jgi:phosphoglycolate phosphatase
MAINAGAGGIGVHYGAHTPEELKPLNPIFTADSVPHLHAWLNEHA